MTGYDHLPTWELIVRTIDYVEHVNDYLVGRVTLYVFYFSMIHVVLISFLESNI